MHPLSSPLGLGESPDASWGPLSPAVESAWAQDAPAADEAPGLWRSFAEAAGGEARAAVERTGRGEELIGRPRRPHSGSRAARGGVQADPTRIGA